MKVKFTAKLTGQSSDNVITRSIQLDPHLETQLKGVLDTMALDFIHKARKDFAKYEVQLSIEELNAKIEYNFQHLLPDK